MANLLGAPGTSTRSSDRRIAVAYAIGGATYPFWSRVGQGNVDPPEVWWALGALMLLASVVTALRGLSSTAEAWLTSAFCWLAATHIFTLASLNDMSPFYSVGSTLTVFASSLSFRSLLAFRLYVIFVAILATALYVAEPHVLKLAYWLGPSPTVAFAYQRLKAQLALEHHLEEEVAERTRQLTDTNQRLRDEIVARVRLENQLRRRHKAEAVGRLAGGVAHDFNNILTTIGVYAELLDRGLPEESALRDEVGRIRHAQLQATELTQQLLTLGRRSHVPTERLDLGEVLSSLDSLLRHLLGDHDLELNLHPGPLPVLANLDQIQQVVINLVLNARDAMEEPGKLTLETSLGHGAALADHLGADVKPGPYAVLVATDTGAGMTPETRERAFDPFFSTKDPGRGSGLGLSTLHGVVSQAGGHVHLESELGRGARFELYWPVASAGSVRPLERITALPRVMRARVLLVEDETPVRLALERALTNAGHRVDVAADGHEAIARLSDPETVCDLVISDVVMPGLSGLELARSLAETRPEVRILLISGHLNDRAMQEWDERFPFLAKPFAPSDLAEKMREVLAPSAAVRP